MAAHRGKGSVGNSRKPVRKLSQCQVRGDSGCCQDVGSGEVTEK